MDDEPKTTEEFNPDYFIRHSRDGSAKRRVMDERKPVDRREAQRRKDPWEFIEEEWESQGECQSCGHRASTDEYHPDGYLVNGMKERYELPCLSDEANVSGGSPHRGVYIYYGPEGIKQ